MRNIKILLAALAIAFSSAGSAQSAADTDLGAMEAELTKLRRIYSDQHPDVMRLLRRIDEMKSTQGTAAREGSNNQPLSKLQAARVRLAELRRLHGGDHPEVEKQIQLVKEIEQEEREQSFSK